MPALALSFSLHSTKACGFCWMRSGILGQFGWNLGNTRKEKMFNAQSTLGRQAHKEIHKEKIVLRTRKIGRRFVTRATGARKRIQFSGLVIHQVLWCKTDLISRRSLLERFGMRFTHDEVCSFRATC